MNRREAIIAGVAGITAAVAVAPTADAQASEGAKIPLAISKALAMRTRALLAVPLQEMTIPA
jgi:hypothetical protein